MVIAARFHRMQLPSTMTSHRSAVQHEATINYEEAPLNDDAVDLHYTLHAASRISHQPTVATSRVAASGRYARCHTLGAPTSCIDVLRIP